MSEKSLPGETRVCEACGSCGSDSTGVCTDCGGASQTIPGVPNTVSNTSANYFSCLHDESGPTSEKWQVAFNVFMSGQPELVEDKANADVLAVVFDFSRVIRFDVSGQTYTVRHCNQEDYKLTWNGFACEFTFCDNVSQMTYKFTNKGKFKSSTDAGGNATSVTAWTPAGEIEQVTRTASVNGESASDILDYEYIDSGENAGLLSSVTSGQTSGSSAVSFRRTQYAHYGSSEAHGSAGDLKTVTQQIYSGGAWVDHETSYLRFYKAGESGGFEHGLKYMLGPTSYTRLKNDPDVPDPLTASDEKVAQYAGAAYQYNSDQQATQATVRCGLLSYSYAYTTSAFAAASNHWHLKTVTTRPDGAQEITFSNHLAQIMLQELTDGTNRWINYTKFDADGRTIEQATPAAIDLSGTPYDESQATLNVQLNTNSGLINVTDHYASTTATETTPGGVEGHVDSTSIKEGSGGTEIQQSETKYYQRTVGDCSSFPVAETTVFKDTAAAEPITTKQQYVWYTNQTHVKQRTTDLPIVPVSQNGTGLQESTVVVLDSYGKAVWSKDARGFITYAAYNDLTGALVQQIQDVDMSLMSGYPLNPGWTTPTGGGLHIITDTESDELGRTTQTLGPVHDVDGQSTRTASWTIYKELEDETLTAQGYARGTSTSYEKTLVNPVSIQQTAEDGSYQRSISAVASDTSGGLCGSDCFSQSTWIRWSESYFNCSGQQTASRTYYNIPESGEGTSGENYNQSSFGYDNMSRQNMSRSPGGTITRTVFDVRGQAMQTWIGTEDASATQDYPSGDDSSQEANAFSNNMKIVTSNEYDNGTDSGNGNLTKRIQHIDATESRVTSAIYDFRNRQTDIDGEVDFYQINTFDNLNRVTKVQRKNTNSGGNLIAQSETKFDNRGRTYRRINDGVDPSTGTVGNSLTVNSWYDADGEVIKSQPAGSDEFTKSTYDGLGRQTARYTADYEGAGTDDLANLTDNKVFEQVQTTYNDASKVIVTASLLRYHDATGTGALVAGTTARSDYTATWYDGIGRGIAISLYGNQGDDAAPFTRPDNAVDASNEALVTQTIYDVAGQVLDTIDPMGIVTRTLYDNAGRTRCTIGNYVARSACGESGQLTPGESENVITETSYNADGNILTLNAKNSDTGDQFTTYGYGTTLDESDIATNDLVRREIYPDTGDGADHVTYTYNRQRQPVSMLDQNGSGHEYEYDPLARQTVDKLTTIALGVDNAVLRIDTGYEVRGMANLFTSYDNITGTGTPVNQVRRTYNDFAQLETSEQEHDGAVDGSTLAVNYDYVDGTGNTSRPTSVTYPDGRVLTFEYGAGDDDKLSRVETLDWNGSDVSQYTYLGGDAIVKENYPVPSVGLDYIGMGNSYSGFDRFGRVVDQKWTGNGGDVDRFQYGYDRTSNRTYRENVVAASQITPVHLDELYGYDDINRMTTAHRGQLDSNLCITDHALSQTWELDATGNWKQFSNYDQANADDVLVQQRTHNEVNEITKIGETVGDQWITPAHDRNGNMITIPQSDDPISNYALIWDAWNRLVEVKDGASIVGRYSYDGLNRRVRKYVPGTPDSYQHFYYSEGDQTLETRQAATAPVPATTQHQFVWSLRYIDAAVLRDDRSADPEEVLYYLGDANFNVTTLIDTSGTTVERYVYDPYGALTVYNADWSAKRNNSLYDNFTLYTGSWLDFVTGLYYYRARYYVPSLGRFLTRDPHTNASYPNLYQYVDSQPVSSVDPRGTAAYNLAVAANAKLWHGFPLQAQNVCGENIQHAFDFTVSISSNTKSCDGYVVQAIEFWCIVDPCRACPPLMKAVERPKRKPDVTFYEAFHIPAKGFGSVFPKVKSTSITDFVKFGVPLSGACGHRIAIGTARFFCSNGRGVGNLNKTWLPPVRYNEGKDCDVSSGTVPSVDGEMAPPAFWGAPDSNTVQRGSVISYDCCSTNAVDRKCENRGLPEPPKP